MSSKVIFFIACNSLTLRNMCPDFGISLNNVVWKITNCHMQLVSTFRETLVVKKRSLALCDLASASLPDFEDF